MRDIIFQNLTCCHFGMTVTTKNNQISFIISTALSKRSDMMNLKCGNICFLAIGTLGSGFLE